MVLIIGSGGQAKVVIDALRLTQPDAKLAVRDGNPARSGHMIAGIPIQTPELPDPAAGSHFHVAIGNAAARQRIFEQAIAQSAIPLTITHPAAHKAQDAQVGPGSFLAAGAIVAPSAMLGKAVIANHNSVIDHDCRIGDFSHIGPGTTLGGAAVIGQRCEIGAGANILPGIEIGDDAIIGAGAVVTKAVGKRETWAGVPAAPLGSGK
jgi:sugar O-acyltransferase (sialic acid O-acetyltransferase NeuD family)